MYFITSFPRRLRQHDSTMVLIDKLTKVEHFIPVKSIYSSSDVAHVFNREVVSLHGVIINIV